MTKTQKVIVLATAALIIATFLYPPYYYFSRSAENNMTNLTYSGWDWIFHVNKTTFDNPYFHFYRIRFDIMSLEILGVLVLSGAAFLVTKKRKT